MFIRLFYFRGTVLYTTAGLEFSLGNTGIDYAGAVSDTASEPALDTGQALSAFYGFSLFAGKRYYSLLVEDQFGLQASFFHKFRF